MLIVHGRVGKFACGNVSACLAQAFGLGFAAALGDGLGKIGKKYSKPQDDRNGACKSRLRRGGRKYVCGPQHGQPRCQNGGKVDGEHDEISYLGTGRQLDQRCSQRLPEDAVRVGGIACFY